MGEILKKEERKGVPLGINNLKGWISFSLIRYFVLEYLY